MEFKGELPEENNKITLDLLDRKMLYLLSLNARYPESSIAKSLKTSKEVINYRIRRITNEGFLRGFITLIDNNKLGYTTNDIHLSIKPEYFKIILEKLENDNRINHVTNCSSPVDLQFRITTKTIKEVENFIEEFLNKNHKEIIDYDIATIIREEFLGLKLLLENNKEIKIDDRKDLSFQKEINNKEENIIIDEKDKEILEILKLNARIPLLEISRIIKLAPTSVRNRIKKLCKDGVIKKFIPYYSLSYIGYQWYIMFIRTKNLDYNKFLAYTKEHPNIVWISKRIGKWNYKLSIFTKNNTELNNIIRDIIENFKESIINYQTGIVFKQYKFNQKVI